MGDNWASDSFSLRGMTASYLTRPLSSFLEIWGTIVWIFVGGHFVIHLFIAWYAWRVVNLDKARVSCYWPIIASLSSVITGFVTAAIIGTSPLH